MGNQRIEATINDHQVIELSITPKDRDGDVVDVENVTWASSDEGVARLEPSADGLKCVAVSTGQVGTATVSCTADADLGDGIEPITQECELTVVQSNAQSLNMSAGVPAERVDEEGESATA